MEKTQLKEGDEVTVKIIQMNEEGDGLANQNGYIFFVSDALPGQLTQIRVKRVSGRLVYTELIRVLKEGAK